MKNVRHQINILNNEMPLVAALLQNTTEKFQFIVIKCLTDAFHHPNIPEKFRPDVVANITGKITDNQGKPVETKIIWEDLVSGEIIEESQSDPVDGKYFAVLPTGKMYGYYVEDEKYYPQSQNVDLTNTKSKSDQTITNDIVVTSYKEMKEQKSAVRLNNLFFDTDKSELLPYSIPELKRVAKILKENNLRVEIAGHTDNVGDDKYNMGLSMRRAEAVKDFLIHEGCPSSLFEVVGYGESKPNTTLEAPEIMASAAFSPSMDAFMRSSTVGEPPRWI